MNLLKKDPYYNLGDNKFHYLIQKTNNENNSYKIENQLGKLSMYDFPKSVPENKLILRTNPISFSAKKIETEINNCVKDDKYVSTLNQYYDNVNKEKNINYKSFGKILNITK